VVATQDTHESMGFLAGVFGATELFKSGGTEHQGRDGDGPIAV